jgi:hypothetical protein
MENQAEKFDVVDSTALDTISRAEFDIQISTAKRYPRNLADVKKGMLSFATLDEETAQSCFYTVPRGDKSIQGPSVRLAEIAVSCYGNLRAGSRVIQTVTSGEAPHVVVQSVCHDLERNVSVSIEKRRRIVGKKKNQGKIDEDDINLACNACAAIAFRDAVFKVIPGALIKPVFESAKAVAIGDATTLSTKRINAIERFGKMGVTKERILGLLNKKAVEEIDLADLETLVGLFTAIKDGQTTIDEAFPNKVASPEFKDAKSKEGADELMGAESPKAPEGAKAPETPKGAEKPKTEKTKEKAAPPAAETPVQYVNRVIGEDGKVPFDDFRDFVKISIGGVPDIDSWASYDEVSSLVAAKIFADAKMQVKIIKTYGKK